MEVFDFVLTVPEFPETDCSNRSILFFSSSNWLISACVTSSVIAVTETVAAASAESVAEAVASVGTAAAVGKTVVAGMDSANMDFHT